MQVTQRFLGGPLGLNLAYLSFGVMPLLLLERYMLRMYVAVLIALTTSMQGHHKQKSCFGLVQGVTYSFALLLQFGVVHMLNYFLV